MRKECKMKKTKIKHGEPFDMRGGLLDVTSQSGEGTGICDLCGAPATESFPVEMYKITDSTRILNTTDFRYQTKTVMLPLCRKCRDKGSWVTTAHCIVFMTLLVAGFVVSITVLELRGFFGIVFGGFLSFMAAGILSFPLYLFTSENRIVSKSRTVNGYSEDGWVVGKRPTKADV